MPPPPLSAAILTHITQPELFNFISRCSWQKHDKASAQTWKRNELLLERIEIQKTIVVDKYFECKPSGVACCSVCTNVGVCNPKLDFEKIIIANFAECQNPMLLHTLVHITGFRYSFFPFSFNSTFIFI
jgi:hypothetical protein